MIHLLATNYQKRIALLLFLFFDLSFIFSPEAKAAGAVHNRYYYPARVMAGSKMERTAAGNKMVRAAAGNMMVRTAGGDKNLKIPRHPAKPSPVSVKHKMIGGPNQPEMSSFKAVSADNMVNLFTGDFNYNIPLLDVGGYPVNIFYSGGIGMEQEASWVGLGWNINPGNINRNMRGVPDDFNGEEELEEDQNIKKNQTWGVSVGGDLEVVGLKFLTADIGTSVGVSYNNYLGPALDLGVKGGVGFKVGSKVSSEKESDTLALKLGVSADLNSRSGLTLSPSVSLTASSYTQSARTTFGLGLSTSYNSRSGIKALQISEQMSFNTRDEDCKLDDKGNTIKTYKDVGGVGTNLFSTSISFARPSYRPAIRIPLSNSAYSGHFQLGGAIWGLYGSVEAEVYSQTSSVSPSKMVQHKPMVGYLYYDKAMNNINAVMDFTRFNDKEVTPNTPIISAPQYTYDVFSIQGEGTGGSIRAYRNDVGYVRDNVTGSQDMNGGLGVDIGIPGHYGANINLIETPTTIGDWRDGNKLNGALTFKGAGSGNDWENVYFRNPGESSVLNDHQYDRIGGTDLVRFRLSGDGHNPAIEPVLDRYSKTGAALGTANPVTTADPAGRKKRTQVIDFLTACDAGKFGLDKQIRSYDNQAFLDGNNELIYDNIDRVDADHSNRLGHHISQINVTESNGKRYVYGIPVYNTLQQDYTFTLSTGVNSPATADKVSYIAGDNAVSNQAITNNSLNRDGYVQISQTPAYAHSFLLSGLLSPDYVDLTGDGITEDDLGNAVKFNYTRIKDVNGNPASHHWRTPYDLRMANFNAGNRTEVKDDKGIVSYGERESWYLHSIESKTMIALFMVSNRNDGKGVVDKDGGINGSDNSLKKLDEIRLYSKADLKMNGLAKAKPIKTVHFTYSYTLCPGTPDNSQGTGKLTLENIYFTFNGQNRVNKDKYLFSYTNTSDGSDNPQYAFNASDRWGTYKPASMNPQTTYPQTMKNSDFPYTPQDQQGQASSPKTTLDQNAGAWSLKKILLPSGGQIEVTYEGDDYAYVQNRRATDILTVVGFGNTSTTITNRLYDVSWQGVKENVYLFVSVPVSCADRNEVYQRYLSGMDQLAVKLAVNMPKGLEYVTSYANIEDYGKYDDSKIWIKLKTVNGISPLSLTAVEYLREQLPGQAFPGYDVSESSGIQQVGEMMIGMLDALKNAFKDPVNAIRSAGKAQTVQVGQCFARLNDPDGYKYGGGQRVKSIRLKDNWNAMTGQYTSQYGQDYDYTTTEVFNGATRTISSGVASYEPTIGGDENPFQTIVQVADKLPLGPVSYGAVEMPVLDAFFPAPTVGYSKVTVKSVPSTTMITSQKSRSGIGRQVTEFYTAKDFPVYYSQTSFDPSTDIQGHDASTGSFFYKYAFDSRALSQGFLVETNDMHGKMKSQTSYAENDTNLRVNYTENFYRNTGVNGLNEKLDFVSAAQGGTISPGNMGIDIELMTDAREFTVKSNSVEIEGQVDLFPAVYPFWLPFIWPVTGNSEQNYRAVTTTKVINYHSILDSVVVFDKGSQVSTKNLIYDAETGEVIVSRTNNEFDQPLYNTSYPAWWAYSGMGLAYKNTDAVYTGVSFSNGRIAASFDQSIFESGDELYIIGHDPTIGCTPQSTSGDVRVVWVFDKNKNTTPLATTHDFMFIDSAGKPYNMNEVTFRIGRSGKRNMLDAKVAAVTSLVSPVTTGSTPKLFLDNTCQVINASASEYREKWQTDNDNIKKLSLSQDPTTCLYSEVADCNGYLEKSINPYRKGMVGNFSPSRSMVFYDNRAESDPTVATNLPQNGFLNGFKLYWDFNTSNNLMPDLSNTKWVWNNQLTRINAKGLELETQNALNIYTAAQYGYNKTMPVAIVNNARYDEMAFEGFEDNDYDNMLNGTGTALCVNQKHADFSNMTNATPFNTDGSSITAHTGKYVLAINSGSGGVTATRNFAISNGANYDYTANFGSVTTTHLDQLGGNVALGSVSPGFSGFPNADNYLASQTTFSNGGFSTTLSLANTVTTSGNQKTFSHNFNFSINYYINVLQVGTYYFTLNGNGNAYTLGPEDQTTINFTITDQNGNVVGYSNPSGNYAQSSYSLHLCPGIYQISADMYNSFSLTTSNPNQTSVSTAYAFSIVTNAAAINYKNLSTSNGCTYTTPVPADATMLNPLFAFPANVKMVFSAWVNENPDAGSNGLAGTQVSYTHNQVLINDGDQTITLQPSGPIIEGWQRYEGVFTPSTTHTGGGISFVNNSSKTIYFDDIRIHPFSADMKSYIYDPVNLRLIAELDGNNYASFYEYDEDGTLVRTKAETRQGIKTIKETRSAKQKNITTFQ